MATYQVIITTGSGTTQGTLTYAGAEANRIFNAFKKATQAPNATQQDFLNHMLQSAKNQFQAWCVDTETVKPVPPDITVGP